MTRSKVPSLACVSSSSSVSSPPPSPEARAPSKIEAKEAENTCTKWTLQRAVVVALLSFVCTLSIFVPAWPSSIANRRTAPCSLSGGNTCLAADEEVHPARHRGKEIGAKFNAADLEAAYQSIKNEYAELALNPSSSTQWQLISSHADGSEVSLLEHPDDPSCPYVRMTSVMPATIEEVWDFLDLSNWATTMPKMDPFYEGLNVLGQYRYRGLDMKLARKTIKRLVTFGKRDFTFVSVSDNPRGDGAWVSGTVSVVTERMPREKGYVRAYQDSIAFYESMSDDPETGEARMKLTIVFRLDLNDSRDGGEGGFVPMWIYVKTVGATGMASVQNMKRQLENGDWKGGATCDNNWLARIRNGTGKC